MTEPIAPPDGNGHGGTVSATGNRPPVTASRQPSPASRALIRAARAERAVGELRSAISILLDRSQFASQTGLSFDAATGVAQRDLYLALGYPRLLNARRYMDEYTRGGIAERLIEAYPRATWTAGVTIAEDLDPENETPFEVACDELFSRLDIWARLLRVDILAGLGRYAILVIGGPGDMATELGTMKKQDDVLYITAASEESALIYDFNNDKTNPRFGLPEFYQVNFGILSNASAEGGTSRTGILQKVHHSRVIHVAEGLLQDEVYGKPRLRSVWNYLVDLSKVVGGGAEAAWKRMDPGLHIDMDKELQLDETGEQLLDDELADYTHGQSRILKTRGTTVNPLAATVTGFGPNVSSVIELISATTGIPQRILMGSERGMLASQNDRDNWNDRVMERRREYAEPLAGRLVQRLIDYGALPEPKEFKVVWPESQEMSEEKKAAAVGSYAAANQAQVAAKGGLILTSNEIRSEVLDMDPIEPDDALGIEPPEPVPAPGMAPPAPGTTPAKSAPGIPAAPGARKPGTPPVESPATQPSASPSGLAAAPRHPSLATAGLRKLHAAKVRVARKAQRRARMAQIATRLRAASAASPNPASAAGAERVISLLEQAILANDTRTVDAILGLQHGSAGTGTGAPGAAAGNGHGPDPAP